MFYSSLCFVNIEWRVSCLFGAQKQSVILIPMSITPDHAQTSQFNIVYGAQMRAERKIQNEEAVTHDKQEATNENIRKELPGCKAFWMFVSRVHIRCLYWKK